MKSQEFKVGQIIKNTDVDSKLYNVHQTVKSIVDGYVETDRERFHSNSFYAGYCLLIKDSTFPTHWYIKKNTTVGKWLNDNSDLDEEFRVSNGYENTEYNLLYYPSYKGSHVYDDPKKLENYVEITLSQFINHYLNFKKDAKKNMEKFIITRTQLKEAYDIVCSAYKAEILHHVSQIPPFEDSIEIPYDVLVRVRQDIAKQSQKELFDRIFPNFKVVDDTLDGIRGKFDHFKIGSLTTMIGIRNNKEYQDKAYYLNSSFNWKLGEDSTGAIILIPSRKEKN